MHKHNYLLQDEMMNPVAFMASSNQDAMYFHQAMKAPEQKQLTKQGLGAHSKRQGPKRHNNLTFCLVNEMQEGHEDTTSLQTQGKAQCSPWQTSVW
jgi:hypothetical protein